MDIQAGRLDPIGTSRDVPADARTIATGRPSVAGPRVAAMCGRAGGSHAAAMRAGLTFVQLLVAIVAAMLVIGNATRYRPRLADAHRRSARSAPVARATPRVALAQMDVVSQQPAVIYADARAFSFNTGIGPTAGPALLASFAAPRGERSRVAASGADRDVVRQEAARDRPTAHIDDGAGGLAFAKTVTFFFAADSTNARVPGAFALWREVNDGAPEALVRNVLPDTVPFFVYRCAIQAAPGSDSLAEVPSDRLPITFADTSGAGIDAQSLRAVELHFLVTNGARGAAQKVERVSILAMLPGAGRSVQPVDGTPPAPVWLFAAAPRSHRLGIPVSE
jgi:hypothetical protein